MFHVADSIPQEIIPPEAVPTGIQLPEGFSFSELFSAFISIAIPFVEIGFIIAAGFLITNVLTKERP